MRAAVHVGRVGGLAVAFGVGFAVLTGTAVASADTTDSDSSSSSSDSKTSDSKTSERAERKRSETRSDSGSSKASGSTTQASRAGDDDDDTEKSSTKTSDEAKPARRSQAKKATSEPQAADDSEDAPEPKQAAAKPAETAVTQTTTQATAHAVTEPAAQAVTPPAAVEQVRTITLQTFAPSKRVMAQVLNSVGLPTSTPALPPSAPQQSALLVALMALGTRRDVEARTLSTDTARTAAAAAAPIPAAAVATPVTTRIGWLTGANSINDTVKRFGIAGTDVGVMWDNGITKDNPATTIVEQRQVLIAFGDTFSNPGMTGNWRNNVLFRSADNVLSNGLFVPNGIIHDPGAYSGSPMTNPNVSREIIGKYGYAVGPEVTIIPTAGISVAGAGVNGATRQYVNFMSVRSWDTPGNWTTNYSGVIYSDDNGQNWTVVPASGIRPAAAGRSTRPFVNGNQNFQMGAYVKPPAGSADAAAGWVYSYGTPAGRNGTVYVSRVNDKQILDQTKYEYWNGTSWVKNNPAASKPVLPGTTTTSFFGLVKNTTYPTAGEMSVQYNPYLKKYVMLYTDKGNNVMMRTSATPQGGWSTAKTLATSSQYPGLYAPMIHPWSGSTQLKKEDGSAEDPQMLYWNLSQWNEYNVALMRTDLSRV